MKIATTSVTQSANETLGTKEKKLYYLIVDNGAKKMVINVGEKTHNEVAAMTAEEDRYNKLTAEEKKLEDARRRAANENK